MATNNIIDEDKKTIIIVPGVRFFDLRRESNERRTDSSIYGDVFPSDTFGIFCLVRRRCCCELNMQEHVLLFQQ
jgi:hypothetical protein